MKSYLQQLRLGDICRPKQWPTILESQLLSEGFPVFGANGLIGHYSAYNHEHRTLAVTCRGATCGEVSLTPPRCYITGNAMALDGLDTSRVDVGYLFQLLKRQGFAKIISGSAQPQIIGSDLRQVKVMLPPLQEQREVATILAAWDNATAGGTALRERLFERKRSMLQQLLTGKTRFKGFENGSWRTVRIGSLLEACDRYVDWSNDQTYRFASIRRRSGGLFDRGTFYGREVKTKVLKLLKAGDFVISKRQVVHGAWAMVTRPFDGFGVSDEYDVLVNRDPRTLDMRFFNYLSQTRRLWHVAYLASNGVHIEKLIFDYDDFAKEKVKIPPTVEEQARIVEVLSACDREIVLLQKQLEALKDQKRGLMQKLLTGQVRVKTEVLKAGNGRRKAGIPNDEDSTANIEVRPGKSAKE